MAIRFPTSPALSASLQHHWRLAVLLASLFAVVTWITAVNSARVYQAVTVLVLRDDSEGRADEFPEFASLSSDYVQEVLASRVLRERVVRRVGWDRRYAGKSMVWLEARLRSRTKLTPSVKGNALSLMTQDQDPVMAARLANAYCTELQAMLDGFETVALRERRAFLDSQIKRTKVEVTKAEQHLLQVQCTGTLTLPGTVQETIRAMQALEVQQYALERDYQVTAALLTQFRQRGEIPIGQAAEASALELRRASLRGRLEATERALAEFSRRLAVLPGAEKRFARVQREYMLRDIVYKTLLQQQRVLDSLQEKRAHKFVVLDVAQAPDRPVRPKPALYSVAAFAVALLGTPLYGALFSRKRFRVT